jgi:AraC-like DNA-binding protein
VGRADGLGALERELADQGVPISALFEDAGIDPRWAEQSGRELTHAQRLALFRSAAHLARRPDTALRAGSRQRIADFGVYGYALATSTTFAEALRFGREHLELAGPVLRITFELRSDRGIFRSHNPHSLGSALPFVAEFWRSSMTTLLGRVLEAPFPSLWMTFPYPAPPHAAAYRETFRCSIEFDSDVMEWHFDAAVLRAPCPNASAVTALICRDFCERVVSTGDGQTPLQREVRSLCLEHQGAAGAEQIATELGLSLRTFHRRLRDEGVGFQALLDGVRQSIAIEYLENTGMPVEEVAWRIGFADASNFRKAFRRWTGRAPSAYRAPRELSLLTAASICGKGSGDVRVRGGLR